MSRSPRTARRLAAALVVAVSLVAAGCGGSSSDGSSSTASTTTTTSAADVEAWATIDRELADLGPDVGFLAARVSEEGTCEPVHEVQPSTPRPIASQFKLFVLGALADQIAAGDIAWDAEVVVDASDHSLGNGEGSLQLLPPGSAVAVEEAATKMISISDNTAADVLIDLVGREAVEATARAWMDDAAANEPFLTTKQVFRLHYVPGLAERYLDTPPDERAAFLASEVDPLPVEEVFKGISAEPRYVDSIEWFASPAGVCRAFAGLWTLAANPSLSRLSTVLSRETAGIDLEPEGWPTVWYKGGSEPGVLTLGWLATTDEGDTFVVEAMASNPDVALSETSITDLRALAADAFALLAPGSEDR